jgi:hypothetical protein
MKGQGNNQGNEIMEGKEIWCVIKVTGQLPRRQGAGFLELLEIWFEVLYLASGPNMNG